MIFKILLISTLILTFIGINDGINDTDERSSLFWADVDKITADIHGELSTSGVNNVPMDEKMWKKWTQQIFLQEYRQVLIYNFWYDLRNEAYVDSWPILCNLLWDKNPNIKRGQECSASRMYEPLLPKYSYRVSIPHENRYQVDLLQCKCPNNSRLPVKQQTVSFSGLYFFVTPCAAFNNSYYIMRQIRPGTLEVYDIRYTNFSPNIDYNFRASEYDSDVQTYGQPGRRPIGNQKEFIDEQTIEKWAQESFMKDYACCTDEKFIWPELRSKTYDQSWPTLCLLILGKDSEEKNSLICTSKPLSESRNYRVPHRILPTTNNNDYTKIYADLLLCKCPPHHSFYVTKSHTFKNVYYIMRMNLVQKFELIVYDMRIIIFNPNSSNTQ